MKKRQLKVKQVKFSFYKYLQILPVHKYVLFFAFQQPVFILICAVRTFPQQVGLNCLSLSICICIKKKKNKEFIFSEFLVIVKATWTRPPRWRTVKRVPKGCSTAR